MSKKLTEEELGSTTSLTKTQQSEVCQGSILFPVVYVSVVLQTPIRTNKVKVHARSVQEENKHLEKQE